MYYMYMTKEQIESRLREIQELKKRGLDNEEILMEEAFLKEFLLNYNNSDFSGWI